MFVGSIDWGTRFALYTKWNSGFWQGHVTGNPDVWRHWLPLFLGAAFTSLILPPFEVAEKAYYGDKTFPKNLQYGYTSRFNALFRIAKENPFALYKNSSPTVAAAFIQTTMAIGIHDFLMQLCWPMVTHAAVHPGSVTAVFFN